MPHSVRIPRPKPRLQVGTIVKRPKLVIFGHRVYLLVVTVRADDKLYGRRVWIAPRRIWTNARKGHNVIRRGRTMSFYR